MSVSDAEVVWMAVISGAFVVAGMVVVAVLEWRMEAQMRRMPRDASRREAKGGGGR